MYGSWLSINGRYYMDHGLTVEMFKPLTAWYGGVMAIHGSIWCTVCMKEATNNYISVSRAVRVN